MATTGDTGDQETGGPLNEQFKREVTSDTVHFAFDQYDIDPEARAILDSQAQWLVAHPNTRITIEGHCDERGTRVYNLALGDRRANSAKKLSGRARHLAQPDHDDQLWQGTPDRARIGRASWAQNRRAVTIVIS